MSAQQLAVKVGFEQNEISIYCHLLLLHSFNWTSA